MRDGGSVCIYSHREILLIDIQFQTLSHVGKVGTLFKSLIGIKSCETLVSRVASYSSEIMMI